jgi:hypothetical protein
MRSERTLEPLFVRLSAFLTFTVMSNGAAGFFNAKSARTLELV